MAHEKQKPSDFGDDEFENAVTTAIPGAVARAFDHDLATADNGDVEVIGSDLTALPSIDDVLEPGFLLGHRFEIVELVHSGGMSNVYKAIDRRRNPDGSGQVHVAIKVMRASLASEHDARLALEREAARAQRLSHPNIVNVFDFDEHDGRFFLVMEWLEGESANELLRRTAGERLDQAFAWQIIEGTAAGVQHAHLHNIVHADINPANVFITKTHEIKLLDFGVARNCGDVSDTQEDRLMWATKAYASPEVLSELAPVVEDDIFSLACFAYRLLSGARPFGGASALEAKRDSVEVAPVPGLHENDWQTLRRALDYNRSNRPKSAAVFLRSTQHAGHLGSSEEEPGTQPWKGLLALTAIVAVVAAGFWWFQQQPVSGSAPASTVEVPTSEPEASSAEATTVEVSPLDTLLEAAALAVTEERFVPLDGDDGNNATGYYREALLIEPDNAIALRGLRSISDSYVQQAEAALRASQPANSVLALAVATDVDPGNPALEIIDYLLTSEANQQLENARRAARDGDIDRANQLLLSVEDYQRIDRASLNEVAALIATSADSQALLADIEQIDLRIAAGQLITPTGDSALDRLLAVSAENSDDPRVLAAADRLGERLLGNAAFATEAGAFAEAGDWLAVVESLEILEAEVLDARDALEAATAEFRAAEAREAAEAESRLAETAAVAAAATSAEPTADGAIGVAPGAVESRDTDNGAATRVDPEPADPPPVRRQSLSDLGIERYVAPKFPRSARRSDTAGFVEVGFVVLPDGSTGDIEILNANPRGVFDASAERAVRQWRFAPRDEPVNARVALSFQPD